MELKLVKDFLTQCSNRIDNLENIFSKLDKDMAIADLEIRLINDKLSASSDDMTSSFTSQLKHELTVSKQELNQFKDDVNEKLSKSETELNKLRDRVGSLVDEKSNLQKKVKSLEAKNRKLSQELLILKNSNASNESRPNKEPSEAQPLELVQVPKSPQPESKTASHENQQNNKSEVNSLEENDVHQTCSTGSSKDSNQEIPEYDVVMLCDSNRKFLDIHKLSGTRNSRMIACGTTDKAIEIINTPKFKVDKALIINTGVNDLKHLSKDEIINQQIEMIKKATETFPAIKVFLSGITPRQDDYDDIVIEINNAVHRKVEQMPNVHHVYNGNLRQRRLYFDVKHLSRRAGVPVLARNIKTEMRKALSPSAPRQRNYNSANQPSQLTLNHQKLSTRPQPQDRDVQVQIIPDPPVVSNNIDVQLKQLTEAMNMLIHTNQQLQYRVMYTPFTPIYNRV